ncbi:hypothetical protein [uncultured Nostoc sp.]|uniref:hypothetical protein n=1 Tax=uncultured Nostoc sp. TaxID=340711 RepID=UPI0035CAD2FA
MSQLAREAGISKSASSRSQPEGSSQPGNEIPPLKAKVVFRRLCETSEQLNQVFSSPLEEDLHH